MNRGRPKSRTVKGNTVKSIIEEMYDEMDREGMPVLDPGNNFTPTPEQIEEACKRIRAHWTQEELERRSPQAPLSKMAMNDHVRQVINCPRGRRFI